MSETLDWVRCRRIRPVRPGGTLVTTVAVLLGWEAVAHNSGSGWVQALGAGLAGVLLVGLGGGWFALRGARLACSSSPADGVAGLELRIEVAASTRVRVRPLEPPGPEAFAGGEDHPSTLVLLPTHRGAYGSIALEIGSAAPFGLMWWSARVDLPLGAELLVSPRTGREAAWPTHLAYTGEQPEVRAITDITESRVGYHRHIGGDPAGARSYEHGDERRHVHWPATAHVGDLMVRHHEISVPSPPVTLWADLPEDGEESERMAEGVLATVSSLVSRGRRVMLGTFENGAPVLAMVADRRQAGRRLARAGPKGPWHPHEHTGPGIVPPSDADQAGPAR